MSIISSMVSARLNVPSLYNARKHPSASTRISTGILGLSSLTLIGSVLLPRPPTEDNKRKVVPLQ